MKRRTKRILGGIGAFVVVIVATPFVAFAITMAGDSPPTDGETLSAHAKQIKDGFVTVGMIDVGGALRSSTAATTKRRKRSSPSSGAASSDPTT